MAHNQGALSLLGNHVFSPDTGKFLIWLWSCLVNFVTDLLKVRPALGIKSSVHILHCNMATLYTDWIMCTVFMPMVHSLGMSTRDWHWLHFGVVQQIRPTGIVQAPQIPCPASSQWCPLRGRGGSGKPPSLLLTEHLREEAGHRTRGTRATPVGQICQSTPKHQSVLRVPL